jgi:alkylation response protein AidB-like acyl-CoA dehydrogenase
MDLAYSDEEEQFRASVGAWIVEHLPRDIASKVRAGQRLHKDDFQRWARLLGQQGWLGYGWPRTFGGPGWNAIQKHLFEEQCALAGAPRIVPFGPAMVAPIIMAHGTPQQQQRFLPGIASGDVWWSQGYSEPGAGSDLASLRTRAVRQGDCYVVNGQKTWTTMAQWGDWMFCLVRTGTQGKPQAGISFLLVDMKSPGLTIRPIKLLDGEYDVNDVFFDDVEVPVENLIGEENKGWTYAKQLLSHERTTISDINRSKAELERLRKLVRDAGLTRDTRLCDDIARLEVDIKALDLMVLRVLSMEKSGRNPLDIAALLKIRGSEITQRCTELMMAVAGPYALPWVEDAMEAGWPGDFPGPAATYSTLAMGFFKSRKTSIYGGSNEVQRNIVAQTVLNAGGRHEL